MKNAKKLLLLITIFLSFKCFADEQIQYVYNITPEQMSEIQRLKQEEQRITQKATQIVLTHMAGWSASSSVLSSPSELSSISTISGAPLSLVPSSVGMSIFAPITAFADAIYRGIKGEI